MIGVLPGILGSLQANEVIKVVSGVGEPLAGRLFLIDTLSFETRTLNLAKMKDAEPITELIDYEQFCGIGGETEKEEEVKEVTVQELEEMFRKDEKFQLIDVREPYEYEISNIGAELIPLGEIESDPNKINSNKKVVIHCRSGKRSATAIKALEKKYGFTNLYNLKGGILAWAREIDHEMATY